MHELIQHLTDNGWVEYPNQFGEQRTFYKRFDTPTRCAVNETKDMNVCVSVGRSYELEILGELSDGTWIKHYQWSMPDDYMKGLAMIPRLLATWEFAANWKK